MLRDASSTHDRGPGSSATRDIHLDADGRDVVTVPDAQLLFNATFKKSGDDLILIGEDGRKVVVHDYFTGDKRPVLAAPNGASLSARVVEALAGPDNPGEYAQAGPADSGGQVIGRVEKATGIVYAIRNGVQVALNVGDVVFKGDTVQTGSGNSSLGISFLDQTVFNLSASARMVLNDMVYDPNGTSNSALMSLVNGTISFVAGHVARTGDMRVETPVATMGIRGTIVLVEITANDGPTRVNVLEGKVSFYSNTTGVEIARLETNANAIQFNADSTFQIVQTQVAPEVAREIINQAVAMQAQAAAAPMVPGTPPPPALGDTPGAPNAAPSEQSGERPVVEQRAEVTPAQSTPATASGTSSTPPPASTASVLATSVTDSSATPTLATSTLQTPPAAIGQTVAIPVTTLPVAGTTETATAGGAGPPPTATTTAPPPAVEPTPPVPGNTPPALTTVGLGPILEDALAQSFALAATDADGDTLSYQVTGAGPRFGSVTVNGASLSYTPSLNANGVDGFALLVSDGRGGTVEQPVSVTITAQNDAPQAPATRSIATLQDRASAPLPMGATDVDGDPLSYALMEGAGPSRGQVAFTDGSMVYTPNAGEIGTDGFTVQIRDGQGGLAEQRVSVVIEAAGRPNGAPVLDPERTQALAGTLVEGAPALTTAGVVFFADSNASDQHTGASTLVAVVRTRADGGAESLTADLGSFSAVLDSQDRSVRWTYAAAEAALDFLAAGETVTVTYEIAVTDPAGAVLTQPVVITIAGTNDAPVVAGTLDFGATTEDDNAISSLDLLFEASDPDRTDSVSLRRSAEGVPILNSVTVTEGSWNAPIAYSFGANDRLLIDPGQFSRLGADESVTLRFDYDIVDRNGGAVAQRARFTIEGRNDAPVITGGGITGSGETASQLAIVGALTFSDPDATDVLTASAFRAAGELGELRYQSRADPAGNTSVVDFGYLVDLALIAPLAQNETRTQSFDIRVEDGRGGFATRNVSFTLVGENDAPVILDAVTAGAVTERPDGTPGEDAGTFESRGIIRFTDLDSTDTRLPAAGEPDIREAHAASTTLISATASTGAAVQARGVLLTQVARAATADPGNFEWVFRIAAADIEDLGEGETIRQIYRVTVTDAFGATVSRNVTITLTGTNDPAVLSSATAALTETDEALTAGGRLTIDDPDGPEAFVEQVDTAGEYGLFSIDADGRWTFTANSDAFAEGQTYTDVFTVAAEDGTTTTVTINILGTNDGPEIDAASSDLTGAVRENPGGVAQATGELTLIDPDAGDTHQWRIISGPERAIEDYSYAIDQLTIRRRQPDRGETDFVTIFEDSFGDDLAPPSAPNFMDGSGGSYNNESGTFREQDGRAFLDESLGRLASSTGGGSLLGQFATLRSNINPNDFAHGLRVDDDFTVEGRFDLAMPSVRGELYGIRLTDRYFGTGGATEPANNAGDDIIELAVRRGNDDGVVRIQLREIDNVTGTVTNIGSLAYAPPPGAMQIVLRLLHDAASPGDITAAIDYLDANGAIIGSTETIANQAQIFGRETAETGDDEIWTRAQIVAHTPATTMHGRYGALTIDEQTGQWSYDLDNARAATQALSEGQTETETFTVRASDAAGQFGDETITITVTGTNDAPTAADRSFTATEDQTRFGLSLPSASDAEGDTITYALPTRSAHGTITDRGLQSGTFRFDYTPDANFNGTDSFTYTVSDPGGASNTYTVTLNVAPVNDAPTVAVTAGPSPVLVEAAGDSSGTSTSRATLSRNDVDGTTRFQQFGPSRYEFVATASDFTWTQAQAAARAAGGYLVTITSAAENAFVFDNVIAGRLGSFGGAWIGGSDAASEGAWRWQDGPEAATLFSIGNSVQPGLFANWWGSEPNGGTSENYVFIDQNRAWTDVGASNGATRGYVIEYNDPFVGLYGSATFDYTTGELTYTLDNDNPDTQALRDGETVTETFEVSATDLNGAVGSRQVTFTIQGRNDAPAAQPDAASFNEDASIQIFVLANDSDPEGNTLAIANPQVVSITDQNGAAISEPYTAFSFPDRVTLSDPEAFQNLADGEVRTVVVSYRASDGQPGSFDEALATFTIVGNTDEEIVGSGNPDSLRGDAGANIIRGLVGNDTLTGRRGGDSFEGGPDIDTVDYSVEIGGGGVVANLSQTDRTFNAGSQTAAARRALDTFGDTDTFLDDIENVKGTSGLDRIFGNDLANRLEGLGGDDRIFGGLGNDVILGGEGADRLYDEEGTDEVFGEGGDDILYVSTFQDRTGEVFDGGEGTDELYVSDFVDFTGATLLSIERLGFGSVIDPDPPSYVTFTSSQIGAGMVSPALAVEGDAGANEVYVYSIDGAPDIDLSGFTFASFDQTPGSNQDTIIIEGDRAGNILVGTSQNDSVLGAQGNDVINGAGGDDRLEGDFGVDTLTGGSGGDTFVFSIFTASLGEQDTVTDFTAGRASNGTVSELLEIEGLDPSLPNGGVEEYVGVREVEVTSGIYRYELYVDEDGTGSGTSKRHAFLDGITRADDTVLALIGGTPYTLAIQDL